MSDFLDLYDEDFDDDDRPNRAPTCRHCGETDLVWRQEASGRWWLYDGFRPHRCPVVFEDET